MFDFVEYRPEKNLTDWIECFWVVQSAELPPLTEQKIIPDGHPEIIVHFADPYEIKQLDIWQRQENRLIAGQFNKFFFLRNVGIVQMVGVKLQPWTLHLCTGFNMQSLVNQVRAIHEIWAELDVALKHQNFIKLTDCVGFFEDWFCKVTEKLGLPKICKKVFSAINDRHGNVLISQLCTEFDIGERRLERFFSKAIGITPKKYARIIRHNFIYKIMQDNPKGWTDVALRSGFFDQAHFIKDFQSFTGEDPSKYGFDDLSFANFFTSR